MKKIALMGMMMVVVGATLPAAEPEVVWPGGNVKVVAGNCAKVETKDGVVYVTATPPGRPNVWPAAYFTFPKLRDLSGVESVRVTLTNCCDETLRIGVKVKAVTEQGQTPDGGTSVQPGAARTYNLRLYLSNWIFDAPHGLVGLKRNPSVGSASSFALEKTRSISVYFPAGTEDRTFGVSRIELVSGDGKPAPQKVLHAATFSPWVDAFGQANYVEWPDKVHSPEEIRAKGAQEEKGLEALPQAIPDADRFGGWAKGPQLKATGHFRTEKVDGKWWLVDPDGHLFFSQGVDHVGNPSSTPIGGREHYFEKLPPETGPTKAFWGKMTHPALRYYYSDPAHIPAKTFDFGSYNLYLKYGADWRAKNRAAIHRRMRSWGLNTIAASAPHVATAGESRMPYTVWMPARSRPIATVKAHWGALLDPFAPEFAENVRTSAEKLKQYADDPWCIGFFSGNEQSWDSSETGLARKILDAPDDQPAKVEFLRRLAEKGIATNAVPNAELRAFGIAVAEKYYSTVRDAARAVAPNLLYLGDRLAWGCPDVVRAAAKYADVVTMNIYDFVPARDLPPGSADKPIMVTEFHFGCYDTGYFYASLIPVKDQTARAAAYCAYVRAALDNPRYVGTHWFCWRDCPITGLCGEGANAQCGLVSMADVPYAELIGAIRTMAAELYPRRFGKEK